MKFELLFENKEQKEKVKSLQWHPDQKQISSLCRDANLSFFDAETGNLFKNLAQSEKVGVDIHRWRPDGEVLAINLVSEENQDVIVFYDSSSLESKTRWTFAFQVFDFLWD